MAKFHQQIKTILSDIEKFLTVSIKDSKIPKSAVSQKTSILEQITSLRNEWPQLQATEDTAPASRPAVQTQIIDQGGDGDDLYEDTDSLQATIQAADQDLTKKEIAATDNTNFTHAGQLRSRKDKKTNLLSKLAKKQYCVLRGKYFYIYDKKTSKKQTETFGVNGYQVTSLEDEAKKDFAFELTCDEKKTYIFEAASHDELEQWLTHLYEATGSQAPLSRVSEAPDDGDDDLYEDTDAVIPRATLPSTSESPPPVPRNAPRGDRPPPALPARTLPVPQPAPEEDQVLYEEGDPSLSSPGSGTPSGESLPRPPPADESQDIYDDTVQTPASPKSPAAEEASDEIYDETISSEPVVNKSSLFSASIQAQSAELERSSPRSSFRVGPTPPPPKKALPPTPGENRPAPGSPQYDSMYYGVWDCTASHDKELSFHRGDIITVLDRGYEDRGWWVGQLQDKIGLVPKVYLSQAYERA